MTKLTLPCKMARVKLEDLRVDARYQGPLRVKRVKHLIANWNDKVGWAGIAVSKRANGELYVIDGQHRVAALVECGFGPYETEVTLYEGLTLADEAGLFHDLNDQRVHDLFERFNSAVLAKRSPELEIAALVEECGWKVGRNESARTICAIAAVKRVWVKYGSDRLRAVLTTLGKAWKYEDSSASQYIIEGLAMYYAGDAPATQKKVAEKLGAYPGGWQAMLTQIKGRRTILDCSMAQAGSQVIDQAVNKYARKAA